MSLLHDTSNGLTLPARERIALRGGPHRLSTCSSCDEEIYLNLNPESKVDRWAHRWSGSQYCDRDETSVAEPVRSSTP